MMRKQPILLIQAIKKNFFIKIFFSLYICLFLGIALPSHHHSDGLDHDDCIFCTMQKQAPLTETVFSLPIPAGILLESFKSPEQCFFPSVISSFHSRAPPVLKLS